MFSHSQSYSRRPFPPLLAWFPLSTLYENYQREAQAVSGRACCGGNRGLCSSEEMASNVIALCQNAYDTAASELSRVHTKTTHSKKNRADGDKKQGLL